MDDNRLWAPWRLAYVKGELPELEQVSTEPAWWLDGADQSCFVCRAAAQPASTGDDRANMVIDRGEHVVTLLNRFPYSNGHLLVSPARHVAELGDLNTDEQVELMATLGRMIAMLRQTVRAQGFNVGLNLGDLAGAGLPGHLHWHIVPRWPGDHNFMSTTAGTRVIPQALDAAWELFTNYLAPGQ
jgi:ATP adenylyltransferase